MATVRKQLTWATANWGHTSIAIAIPLIFFLFSGINFYRAFRPLSSLDWVQGLVSGSTPSRTSGRTQPLVVLSRLRSNSTNFGILQGYNKAKAEVLVARIQPGDSLTVYYDADGAAADGINLHVYQVEKPRQILYSIHEMQDGEGVGALTGLLFGVGFALWIGRSLRRVS